MASVRLQPPEPFNFKVPDEWPRWKRRYEQFRLASGLSTEDDLRQVSTLLYCLGQDAEDILRSPNISAENRGSYTAVLAAFDAFFKVRRNVIFERARFNRRNQQEGESVEKYIVALYSLSENCEYGDLRDEMIRDRLVVGIKDVSLSERLQTDPNLTLEKAKRATRQREAVHEQQLLLKEGDNKSNPIHIDQMKGRPRRPAKKGHKEQAAKSKQPAKGKQCIRCGRSPHNREDCPALEATCHRCRKKGHYGTQCRTKHVSQVEAESTLESAFLDTVAANEELSWRAKVLVGSKEVEFKLDTGAEVTAISDNTYRSLEEEKLVKPTKTLYGPGHNPLEVLGQLTKTLSYKQRSSKQRVFVVRGLKSNLLSLPAITALNLAVRVNAISDYGSTIWEAYPQMFQGLGNFGEPYQIKLRPEAKPHALYSPRSVPLPLRNKVKEELTRMESLGVISRVDEPTPWCAGIVVVHKKSGALRICVDMKPLNESIEREIHPLPKVDETLAQLTGAKVFSKLDANCGFWQIPLDIKSRHLTTFITPFGRFCFNKLPFGISSAPEHFQKRMSRVLEGLEGVVCQMDDVLVHGHDSSEHDGRLTAVLKCLEAAGVTLNPEKCSFGQHESSFWDMW